MNNYRLRPTSTQMKVFAAYVRMGSQKSAACELGVSTQTVKNHMHELYDRLRVGGAMEAAAALGWIHLPSDGRAICGWVGYCSRPLAHHGHHGGMRTFSSKIFIDERPDGESGREDQSSVI